MRGGRVINQYYEIARNIVEFKGTWLHPFKILLWGKRSKKELKNRKKDLSKFLNKMGLRGRYRIKIWMPKPKERKDEVIVDEWAFNEIFKKMAEPPNPNFIPWKAEVKEGVQFTKWEHKE